MEAGRGKDARLASPATMQEDVENAVAMLPTHRLLGSDARSSSKPSSARAPMEAAVAGVIARVQDSLSIHRFGSKTSCDSNVAFVAHETLQATKATEGIDQMSLAPEGIGMDKSPVRRSSKRASSKHSADFGGVQETLRQRRLSKSMTMRDAQADHFTQAVAHSVDMANHPQGQLVGGSPRRSSKAVIGGPVMPLNIVGARVVAPEVVRNRRGSRTGSYLSARGPANHVPNLDDLIILGGGNDIGAAALGNHAERRTISKGNEAGPRVSRSNGRRTMTAPPSKAWTGLEPVQQAATAHEALLSDVAKQQVAGTNLSLNGRSSINIDRRTTGAVIC